MLVSCDRCQEVDCPNPFNERDLLWLPYSIGDKLVFIDLNSSDSLIYNITNNESDKVELTEDSAPYCIVGCFYHNFVSVDRIFSDGEEEKIAFGMDKSLIEYRLGCSARINNGPEFKFADAIRLDSISVNNYYIKDVYKYICNPEQEKVAETYMHQGMGLVKIVFRDGQSFELVEHIKK